MYLDSSTVTTKSGKQYTRYLLRTSFRQNGRVKHQTLCNLSHCSPGEIAALRLALRHKDNLAALGSIEELRLRQGRRLGAVWVVHQIARRLGLDKALGAGRDGKLALWQVIARLLDQGSRLSAVRLAQSHAAGEILGLASFDENNLYQNLAWLDQQQPRIERKLFAARRGATKPELFLYDVTSSYLEGDCNELAAYGYNRDKKQGKKQIVIGLLCDEAGEPVSVEVFEGNTGDVQTFGAQVAKAAGRFGCERVTFVGDRGMIKSGQVEELAAAGFHYITAITKPQIETLLKTGAIQLGLFDKKVCEVEQDGVRYVLRRNPARAAEMAESRADKRECVERQLAKWNIHLSEHPRAKAATAQKALQAKIDRLKISGWLSLAADERTLKLMVDEGALAEAARLDGCYVIKTDLPRQAADAQTVHDRYKDLTEVERAFRTQKTGHLELRPIYVRKAESTRGHVLVVMLAYLIRRELARCWRELDCTVAEGLDELGALCLQEVKYGEQSYQRVPRPTEQGERLLRAAEIILPEALPNPKGIAATKRKLPERRK